MKPPRFDYVSVDTVEFALELLAEYGDDATLLAGGQSLLPMLNMRVAAPQLVIDLQPCASLDFVRATPESIEIGAMYRQGALERWQGTREKLPLMARALPYIGHYQTRSRGTVGGSLAHADPSAEIPLIAAIEQATVRLRSVRGERHVPAQQFIESALDTVREPDELVSQVDFQVTTDLTGTAFEEVSMRRGDFAIVAVAARADDETIALGLAGVEDRPVVRTWSAAEWENSEEAVDVHVRDIVAELEVMSDHHADANYRRRLVVAKGAQALRLAVERRG